MGVKPPTAAELADITAIEKLRTLYSHYFDGHEIDKMAMLFTEDALCEFSDDLPYGDWVGRDEIREQYRKVAAGVSKPFSFMHASTNGWVELTGADSATGRWYLIDMGFRPGRENPIGLTGVYNDVYKKVNGEWFIHRTRIDHIWTPRPLGS